LLDNVLFRECLASLIQGNSFSRRCAALLLLLSPAEVPSAQLPFSSGACQLFLPSDDVEEHAEVAT
jgi:hypothetical protein